MSINFGVDQNGYVEDQLIEYLARRAEGGAGMILAGGGNIHPDGMELPDLPRLWEDGCISGLTRLVQRIKPFDTRLGMQLMHGGRQCYLPQKVAPSAIPAPAVVKGEVRALTREEITEVVNCFGDAARRCRQAGLDFIELHAAHGYLINQFMAKNSNIREDEYGGSFENHTRFLFEIMENVKEKAGADFPVGVRINGSDYIRDGWTLEDTLRLAPMLEKAGAAYLHVSAGVYGSTELTIPSMYVRQGCFVHLAKAVKETVSIPVVAVGRIKDPKMADDILSNGSADIVAMGRPLLADPDLPEKARNGEFSRIRPCLGCCLGCIHTVLQREPGSCVVNPQVGREYQAGKTAPSENRIKVLVAGAGPAGLACARSFALQGHDVTVCEKTDTPGGLLSLASKAPGRSELNDILTFFLNELQRLSVPIRLKTPVSAHLLEEIEPDRVIIATGSLPDMPIIKGLFQTRMNLVTCVDLFEEQEPVKGKKAIVLGGGMTALLSADYLAEKGCGVVVLNRKNRFAEEMSSNDRYYLRERLKQNGVVLHKNVKIRKFSGSGVTFGVDGTNHTIDNYDAVVISEKMSAIRDAAEPAKNSNARFDFIGDARSPRHLMYCISEAEEAACSI
ncbi:MAG: NAD(P)/FAD-dependent oxidoreductase [Desulfarculaceae bacterium]|nr:NAD(P)/FAD-dependent oxidoreductase [Desulfarculaceae bacterium]